MPKFVTYKISIFFIVFNVPLQITLHFNVIDPFSKLVNFEMMFQKSIIKLVQQRIHVKVS